VSNKENRTQRRRVKLGPEHGEEIAARIKGFLLKGTGERKNKEETAETVGRGRKTSCLWGNEPRKVPK